MSKRALNELCQRDGEEEEESLLLLLTRHCDMWRVLLDWLEPRDHYALKLVANRLRPPVEQYIATKGPLCLLVWRLVRPCGTANLNHSCGLGYTPCAVADDAQPVKRMAPDTDGVRPYVQLSVMALRGCRFDQDADHKLRLHARHVFSPYWGNSPMSACDTFWLSDQYRLLTFNTFPNGATRTRCGYVTRAILCWNSDVEPTKRLESEVIHTRPFATDGCLPIDYAYPAHLYK